MMMMAVTTQIEEEKLKQSQPGSSTEGCQMIPVDLAIRPSGGQIKKVLQLRLNCAVCTNL